MCGLAGSFTSYERVIEITNQLFSRGRDSVGIGCFANLKSQICKKLNSSILLQEISHLEQPINGEGIIGHNRWASSGKVSLENAHPFLSADQNIILAHNGTLTDYEKVRLNAQRIYNKDYSNKTDSEVLTDFLGNQLTVAGYYQFALKELIDKNFNGTYAILYLIKGQYSINFMVHDSPLYYYEGEFSSDPSIFPHYFSLPNYSYGHCTKYDQFYSLWINSKLIKPEYIKNETFREIKETFIQDEDYMLREIKEQANLSYNWGEKITCFGVFHSKYENVQLIGCGSSYNAALYGKQCFEDAISWKNVSVHYASEYVERNKNKDFLKLFISQSGETADVLEIMKNWQQDGRNQSDLIVNRPMCTCSQYATNIYPLWANEELAVAATKTFTSTCLMLLAMSQPLLYKNLDLDRFRKDINEIILQSRNIAHRAFQIKNYKKFLVLGSGLNYPICREIALKLKEVSNIFAESIPSAEQKHGPISLITSEVLSIFIMPSKENLKYSRILGNVQQIKARNGVIMGIGPNNNELFDYYLPVPETHRYLQPLLNNVAGQFLSYYLAKEYGLNPSTSKNCAKAITVY